MHLYFHMLIIHCAYFIFIFSIQGKCDQVAILVVSLWSSVFFCTTRQGGKTFWFQLERKTWQTWDVNFFLFFFLLILHWNGKWYRCSIFLDKYTNEVFLVWWYCTIYNISGTICHFEHRLSKFLIWQWKKKILVLSMILYSLSFAAKKIWCIDSAYFS